MVIFLGLVGRLTKTRIKKWYVLLNRLGLMVAGGIVLASFMTYASEHLAIRSFLRGLEDRDSIRTRSACFLC